jgi:hypothetical protein
LFYSTNKKSVLFCCPSLRALEHKRGKNAFMHVTLTLYPKPRAHKFSKNPGLSSKFSVSEEWLDEHSMLTTGVIFEPHSYVVISVWCLWTDNILWCKGKEAIITLKMLGPTIQYAFNHVVRHLGFVHFCPHLFLQSWNWFSNGLESGRTCENTGICNHQALACSDTIWGYADQSFLETCKNMGSWLHEAD